MKKKIVMSLFLSMGFLVSVSIVKPLNVNAITKETDSVASQTIYVDFNKNAYWADNMLWAIDMGLLQGYKNIKNPRTGKLENYLKPNELLTESQFATILLRYMTPQQVANIPSDANGRLNGLYTLLGTKGFELNSKVGDFRYANQPITRGLVAKAIATHYHGVPVSERDAIQLMYDANVANGYGGVGSPKTYENFGANKYLTRAHVVTFMKNYDTYLENEQLKIIDIK